MTKKHPDKSVVIVGGGFAGIACAKELAARDFVSWAWDYFSKSRASSVIDRIDAAQIDWGDEDADPDDDI